MDARKIPPEEFPVYKHWPYIKIFRYNMIKQPDFLMLPFFFSGDYDLETKRKNFEYYEKVCSHESSLSPSIHSILAAELGKNAMAYDFFMHTSRLDLDNYNRNTEQGLHMSANAGVWLNIVHGFAGMRTDGPILSFTPSIPSQWNSYSFTLLYKGATIKVSIDKKKAHFQVTDGPSVKLALYDVTTTIGKSAAVSVPLRKTSAVKQRKTEKN